MKTGMLLGVAALSLGVLSVPNAADAHGRHRHHHRGGIHVGVHLGGAYYYRAEPVYGYGYRYRDDGYRYSDYDYGDYGYGSYYSAPYSYVDTYYVRTPRIYVHSHGHRNLWRSHGSWRHHR